MERYYITAKAIVTMNESRDVWSPGAIAVKDGYIEFIGPVENLPKKIKKNYSYFGRQEHVIMPGFVNIHTHSAMTLYRGMVDDIPVGDWLLGPVRKIEEATKKEDHYYASVLGFTEMLRFGVTCAADRAAQFEEISKAAKETGIRAVLARSLRDINGPSELEKAIYEIENLQEDGRLTIGLGPHATDTCSIELLTKIREAATKLKVPIFLHVSQSEAEVEIAKQRGFNGCVDMLNSIGFLAPDVIMAHCIYINDDEIQQIADAGAWVAHCPKSNAKIEARVFPAFKLAEKGGRIALATDAAACNNIMDMFEEMRFAGILQKITCNNPTIFKPQKLLEMATIDGARALGLDEQIGSLEVGKKADIITVKTGYHLYPCNDIYSNLVYAARGNDIDDVIVNGEFLISEGEYIKAQYLSNIIKEVEERAKKIYSILEE